jgi:hypothetical protein
MALADHVNVLSDEGGILLPKGLLPEGWAAAKDVRSIPVLSRDFVFPGGGVGRFFEKFFLA